MSRLLPAMIINLESVFFENFLICPAFFEHLCLKSEQNFLFDVVSHIVFVEISSFCLLNS